MKITNFERLKESVKNIFYNDIKIYRKVGDHEHYSCVLHILYAILDIKTRAKFQYFYTMD